MKQVTQQLKSELKAAGILRKGKSPSVRSVSVNGYYKAEALVDILTDEQQEMLMASSWNVSIKNNPAIGCSLVYLY